MKFLVLLALFVTVATAASVPNDKIDIGLDTSALKTAEIPASATKEQRNQILVNILVNQLIAYVRRIINNGSQVFGIPPLDPFVLNNFHLALPAGLIHLNIEILNGLADGFGRFVTHRSFLRLSDLTFDLDISFPTINIQAEHYKLGGDLFGAIPVYGDGDATFVAEGFRFRALLHLKQSADGKSVLIESVENVWFELPTLTSQLNGALGGGDIDNIVNAVVSEVIVDYVNRFNGFIGLVAAEILLTGLNPILEQLDTWRYIGLWVPK